MSAILVAHLELLLLQPWFEPIFFCIVTIEQAEIKMTAIQTSKPQLSPALMRPEHGTILEFY